MIAGGGPYRGIFLCGDGESFVIHAKSGASDDIPTPDRAGLRISRISRIERLQDPPSLVDSNKAATMLSARAIIGGHSQES